MTSLIFFVEKIAFGLYILSAGAILLMVYRLRRARRDLVVAQFKLEREHAQVRQASAITFGGLLIEFVIAVWAITNLMAPTVRDIQIKSGPGTGPAVQKFVTSTPAANPLISLDTGVLQDDEMVIFATPVPTATPVGTILPEAEEIVGCARDSAWFLIPGNGQLLFEATTVVGTASISNFSFYRFEIKPARGDAEFAPIGGDYTVPVVEGPLGDILPFNFAPGEYRFRLTVFDNTNMMRALCEVTIHISAPPPTPTPIGGEATPAP
ncbi:MAG: hypothetical protein JXJ20_12910 [Anaerolineae bacterium]|jgi:hypothetical protein|nr:hypothetical protein [Anaerolineae bacterium]